jgi:hypothetical protein
MSTGARISFLVPTTISNSQPASAAQLRLSSNPEILLTYHYSTPMSPIFQKFRLQPTTITSTRAGVPYQLLQDNTNTLVPSIRHLLLVVWTNKEIFKTLLPTSYNQYPSLSITITTPTYEFQFLHYWHDDAAYPSRCGTTSIRLTPPLGGLKEPFAIISHDISRGFNLLSKRLLIELKNSTVFPWPGRIFMLCGPWALNPSMQDPRKPCEINPA